MPDSMDRLKTALADRYTIDREIGAGGMATVYLAHDVKHDRDVALKVLRPELAAVIGGERFLAEIKTTANLQHPHILPLFDSGEADSFLFYVMPYIEGEPLRDRLDRETQLPVEDAIRIASEVASALDYAHRHDVIHRDIKPENILLHDNRALVADFGIALAASKAGGSRMTETGMSLGTPHYMSPEQAMGDRELDARSDVYALGCVLYEMLVGEPPFTGPSAQAVVAKVMTEEPAAPTKVRKTVPPGVEATTLRALQKLPADRFATPAEFALALSDPRTVSQSFLNATVVPPRSAANWLRDWRPWAAGVVLVGLAAIAGASFNKAKPADPPLFARFSIPVPEGQSLTGAPVNTLALSPDGRTIVYVGRHAGSGTLLFRRDLASLEAVPIAGTEGASFPTFSPDGTRVMFFGPGGMFVAPVTGGTLTSVSNVNVLSLTQAVWYDTESFIVTEADGTMSRLAIDGTLTPIAKPDSGRQTYLGVNAVLPGGETVLSIAATTTSVDGTLEAVDVQSGQRTALLEGTINAVWYSDGHLLWSLPTGALMGAAFDLERLQVVGTPVTLAEGVRSSVGGSAQAAVSATGSLVYVPEHPFNLMLVDREGRREIIGDGRRFHNPRFSPDGRQLAVDFTHGGSRDVWTMDLRQRTLSRLTFEGDGHDALWTPDGRHLVYITGTGIARRRADGSGTADSIFVGDVNTGPLAFTPDGQTLITSPTGVGGSFDLGFLSMGNDRAEQPLIATPFNEQSVALSPDGRWLAYASDETGVTQLYVRPFPEGGAKVLVSREGGYEPRWHPNGRELFYIGSRNGLANMMAATVSTRNGFEILERVTLFDVTEFEPSQPHANWDISPDGRQFVMVHLGSLSEMIFVLNWPEAVRQAGGRVE